LVCFSMRSRLAQPDGTVDAMSSVSVCNEKTELWSENICIWVPSACRETAAERQKVGISRFACCWRACWVCVWCCG
jgi:hypothetical protein